MLNAQAEADLRAILALTRGCEKAHGKQQVALLFAALGDRLEVVLEEYGETAWKRRVGQLPIAAVQQRASGRV